jgi:hypothetical protein
MPRATTNANDTERVELKSCPGGEEEDDGYVVLRRMNYGQMVRRRQMSMAMTLRGVDNDTEGTIEAVNRNLVEFEFAVCIVEHNLTDDRNRPLDFKKGSTLDRLDPRVGDEISQAIDDMNQLENLETHLEDLDTASDEA